MINKIKDTWLLIQENLRIKKREVQYKKALEYLTLVDSETGEGFSAHPEILASIPDNEESIREAIDKQIKNIDYHSRELKKAEDEGGYVPYCEESLFISALVFVKLKIVYKEKYRDGEK
jgi:hypothetical protein